MTPITPQTQPARIVKSTLNVFYKTVSWFSAGGVSVTMNDYYRARDVRSVSSRVPMPRTILDTSVASTVPMTSRLAQPGMVASTID